MHVLQAIVGDGGHFRAASRQKQAGIWGSVRWPVTLYSPAFALLQQR